MTDDLGHRFTVSEAARDCRIDRRTLRRFLDRGDFPNARRKAGTRGPDSGPWEIPLADLVAAGLRVHQPAGPDVPTTTTDDLDTVARLRADLDAERHRRELAEHDRDAARAVATERAESLADLRNALRMLEAGQAATPAPTPTSPQEAVQPAPVSVPERPPRRHWWSRS